MILMGFVLAAIVAALAGFVLGMLWYGPLFGKQWMKLSKIKKMDKPAAAPMVFAFIKQFVSAVIIANILAGVPPLSAVLTTFVLWLGFTAAPALSDVLWANRPFKLYLINVSYELVSFVLMALIITSWF